MGTVPRRGIDPFCASKRKYKEVKIFPTFKFVKRKTMPSVEDLEAMDIPEFLCRIKTSAPEKT